MTKNSLPPPLLHHHYQPRMPLLFHALTWYRANSRLIFLIAASIAFPVFLPLVHLGLVFRLWDQYLVTVDRKSCTCSCWDTGFKGIYETGVSNYKHVYFNLTSNTFKIWMLIVIGVVAAYETCRRVIRLALASQLRLSMLFLLGSIVYPHYYSWWSYFNYWNDDFYYQWNHQLFFTITELASTLVVILLLDSNVPPTVTKLLVILNIALLHILVSGFDQFVSNVVRGEGNLNQILRDINLMWPDIAHVVVPLWELKQMARALNVPTTHLITTPQFVASISFIASSWLLCLIL